MRKAAACLPKVISCTFICRRFFLISKKRRKGLESTSAAGVRLGRRREEAVGRRTCEGEQLAREVGLVELVLEEEVVEVLGGEVVEDVRDEGLEVGVADAFVHGW